MSFVPHTFYSIPAECQISADGGGGWSVGSADLISIT